MSERKVKETTCKSVRGKTETASRGILYEMEEHEIKCREREEEGEGEKGKERESKIILREPDKEREKR